jgi:hypothetical protein
VTINSLPPSGGFLRAMAQSFATSQLRGDLSAGGFLTDSDIALIKAATNTEFNWPPADGEGAPQAAFDLSMLRLRQMQQGSMIADFTAQDLAALRRAGLIDADFFTNAVDYLSKRGRHADGPVQDEAPPMDLTRKSGTTAPDGSVFL